MLLTLRAVYVRPHVLVVIGEAVTVTYIRYIVRLEVLISETTSLYLLNSPSFTIFFFCPLRLRRTRKRNVDRTANSHFANYTTISAKCPLIYNYFFSPLDLDVQVTVTYFVLQVLISQTTSLYLLNAPSFTSLSLLVQKL